LRVDSQDEQVRPETLKVCVETPRDRVVAVDSRGRFLDRDTAPGDVRKMMLRSLEYHFILTGVMALPVEESGVPPGLQHETSTSEVDPWQDGGQVPSRQHAWYVGGGASGNGPGQQLGWSLVCVCGGGGGGQQRASGGSWDS